MDGFDQTLESFDVNKEYIMKKSCKDEDTTDKGISVVVDVSGPLESKRLACVSGTDVENPRSKILEYESSIIGRMLNGALNRDDKTTSSVMHVEFSSGNLVWIKGIASTWWPGLISNPSDSADAASNLEFSNALLVKYFGTNRMVWCDPSHLKLFVENFDEMSKMNNSKMFLYSIDKAVTELSLRLGLDMGCSCKSEQGKGISGKSNHAIISNFQPELFLPFLKCLARDGFKAGFLEVTSVKNLLTSFYRYKVHSRTTEENLIAVSAEPGQETREKRKSKYLSSPYTNKNKSVTEEPSSKSSTKGGGGKKSNKKQKQSNVKHNSSVLARDDMNKPPLEILSNLLEAAVTGHSVSDKGYFSEFRKWTFCDKSIFDLHVMKTLNGSNDAREKVKKETEIVKNGGEEDTPIITFMRKKPRTKKQLPTAIPNLDGPVEKDIQEGSSNKNKQTETSCLLPGISANETDLGKEKEIPAINSTLASFFSEMCPEEGISTTDAKSKGKKRKWKNPRVIPGFVKANISTGLPDLNGNANENENESPQGQHRVTESSSSSAFKSLKKLDFSSLQDFLAINREVKLELNQSEIAGNIEQQTESQPKKKKMKNKASEENPNENSLDPNPRKKQKKIKKSDMNLTYKRLVEEDESVGSALLLKFDKEQPPLPTKEALLLAFSGFGNLKESETDVFIESHTAQVVFLNGSEAGNAFRSLEKTGPFGPSLITFRLIHISEPPPEMKYTRPTPPLPLPSPSFEIPTIASAKGLVAARRAASLVRKPPQQQQQPQHNGNLMKMRNHLEMMTRVLEKTGSNLAPDLRLKLENDINGLLTKLRKMDGGTTK